MSVPLLGIVSLIYAGVAIDLFFDGKSAMALVFFAYSVANLGLIWGSR